YVNGSLYQDLTTTPGTVLTWQFAHRGRTGVDTLNLKIGPPGATVAQINPTTGTTSFTTDNSNWVVYQGTYTVPPGQTTTQFEFVAVSTASGDQAEGNFLDAIKFGPLCDHGDADASYPVERTNGGAAHTRDGATYLGNQVFAEIAANPSTAADGDDNATGDGDFQDDEDGVTFTSPLAAGSTATVDVVASVAAPLSAWIDFNNNGSWDDPGEQIFADEPLTAGANSLSFTIPVGATVGNTYARFRISSQSGLAPTGIVGGGEVEDYRVVIQPLASNPNVVLVKRITAINGDRTQNPNDNTPLNAVANDGTANSPDDELNWPPNYLLGETNAGLVLPGDQIEYTVYYLNARADAAEQVRICDWIQANQSVVPGLYNGNDVELQIGEGTGSITYELTLANDPGDRAQIATVDALPAGPTCNLPATSAGTTDDVLVIDLTGTTGDPSVLTTTLPGSTAPGTPDEAFGFFRFTTKVDE
ncbi:MAG: GEVED domain-containing protein, partial [Cyanobacteria bacterium J06597_16]